VALRQNSDEVGHRHGVIGRSTACSQRGSPSDSSVDDDAVKRAERFGEGVHQFPYSHWIGDVECAPSTRWPVALRISLVRVFRRAVRRAHDPRSSAESGELADISSPRPELAPVMTMTPWCARVASPHTPSPAAADPTGLPCERSSSDYGRRVQQCPKRTGPGQPRTRPHKKSTHPADNT
jgi:hypothetical protein